MQVQHRELPPIDIKSRLTTNPPSSTSKIISSTTNTTQPSYVTAVASNTLQLGPLPSSTLLLADNALIPDTSKLFIASDPNSLNGQQYIVSQAIQCPMCDNSFLYSSVLQEHLRTVHGQNIVLDTSPLLSSNITTVESKK